MSFDDYAEYITQKYRLSAAIAVLNTKPENLTTEQYLNVLKNNDKMDVDLDITICSDDFNLDDDDVPMNTDDLMDISETILKDYNLENDHLFDEVAIDKRALIDKSIDDWPQSSTPYFPENLTQPTYYETQPLNPNPIVTHSDHTNPIIEQVIDNDATYCDTNDIENNIPRNIIEAPITTDSQKTILYTVYGYTQNTHFSPSQTNIIIPKEHIYGFNNNIINISKRVETNADTINVIQNRREVNNKIIYSNYTNDKDVYNDNERTSIENNSRDEQIIKLSNENLNGSKNTWNIMKNYSKECQKMNVEDVINDIRLTNVKNDSQDMNYRHVLNDIRSNQITSKNRNDSNINDETERSHISQTINIISPNFDEYDTGDVINEMMGTKIPINSDNTESNDPFINKDDNTKEIINLASNVQKNDIIINNCRTNEISETLPKVTERTYQNSQNTNISSQNDEILNDNNDDMNPNTKNTDLNEEINENNKQIIHVVEKDVTQEVIPFKILEEFNKVKSFLNRNEKRMSTDGSSTDSGYRSDSQGRKSALQLSSNWINQSGHCLFDYIMSCHLVVSTRDITNEIAEVLGQLVDKLHEDEKYPTFMEALLEANNSLLRQLHEGENSIENVMLSRDENIQRLVLLNKSVHIQKYCIEKITNILTDYHTKLTDTESIFELAKIDQIENLHYLFHILEILLQKYNKNKELLSQTSTQTSQDEGIFKKSSITDLWKRKWNPNYQDGGNVGSCEKTCVLQVCCETLNKIIVDSLNSYSLVSYAALKCFNLTQS